MDAVSLHSVVHEAPAPPETDHKQLCWVKLINKSWYLGRRLFRFTDREPYEPIERLIQPDIGWLKALYQSVMTELYSRLRFPNDWVPLYECPPQAVPNYNLCLHRTD